MLRTALFGMGGIGTHLAQEITDHPHATLAAAVDVNSEQLAVASRDFDVDESALFTDVEEMYAEISSLDAVVIATPPVFHYERIVEAFERGLHVLCEKPVVMNREEACGVLELVESSSQTLMAGYQRHLNPGFIEAYERWHESGREPTFITGELTQDWTGHFEAGTNWRTDPEIGGGGHLFSVGTHVVESILWMTGLTPEWVTAEMDFYDDDQHIDKQAALTVRFDNGAIACLGDSAMTPATREHIHVWDDDGAVYLEGKEWGRRELTLLDERGTDVTPEVNYDNAQGKFEAFVTAIRTNAKPPATAKDVLRVTALLETAYESAREGRRVAVDLD